MTLSPATDVHVLAIAVLNFHISIQAAVPEEKALSSVCFAARGNDLLGFYYILLNADWEDSLFEKKKAHDMSE